MNEAFVKHKDIKTGVGILVSLPKSGKVKGPVNYLRPVILLLIIRKMLSKIVLERTNSKVENFLPDQKGHIDNFAVPQT